MHGVFHLDSYTILTCGPLQLAVFLPGNNNADLQSRTDYLKDAAPLLRWQGTRT